MVVVAAAHRTQYDEPQREHADISLALNPPVQRYEAFKLLIRRAQKVAVQESCPPALLDRHDLVVRRKSLLQLPQ